MPRRQKSLHPLWRTWGPQLNLFTHAQMRRLRSKKCTTPESTGQGGSGMILGYLDKHPILGAMGERPSIYPTQLTIPGLKGG